MNFLHLRTDYERVADAIAHLAEWAADDSLTLSHDRSVPPGTPVSFRVSLEDDTSVLEGTASCRACDDLGDDAPALSRFEVSLAALDFDPRSEAMWQRVLTAAGTGAVADRAHSRALPSRPVSAAPPSTPPPRPPSIAPMPGTDTRIVRSEDLLRSSSIADLGPIASEPSQGPTRMIGVARDLHERAERLASSSGEARTSAELIRLAMRIGLAVLEEQSAAARE